jgi:hypothetical protein
MTSLSPTLPSSSSPFVSRLPSETCSIIAHTCLSTSAKLPAFHYCRLAVELPFSTSTHSCGNTVAEHLKMLRTTLKNKDTPLPAANLRNDPLLV